MHSSIAFLITHYRNKLASFTGKDTQKFVCEAFTL